jgi:hypothetical protein
LLQGWEFLQQYLDQSSDCIQQGQSLSCAKVFYLLVKNNAGREAQWLVTTITRDYSK